MWPFPQGPHRCGWPTLFTLPLPSFTLLPDALSAQACAHHRRVLPGGRRKMIQKPLLLRSPQIPWLFSSIKRSKWLSLPHKKTMDFLNVCLYLATVTALPRITVVSFVFFWTYDHTTLRIAIILVSPFLWSSVLLLVCTVLLASILGMVRIKMVASILVPCLSEYRFFPCMRMSAVALRSITLTFLRKYYSLPSGKTAEWILSFNQIHRDQHFK